MVLIEVVQVQRTIDRMAKRLDSTAVPAYQHNFILGDSAGLGAGGGGSTGPEPGYMAVSPVW